MPAKPAMVSGVDVYPAKSLMDVIHFVRTGNGMVPRKVADDVLLGDSQHYAVELQGCSRAANRQARAGDRLCRPPQHPKDRPAWIRKDHAWQAHAHHPPALH